MQRTEETSQPIAHPGGAGLIQVEHLCRTISTHAQKTVLLDDITFSVPAGTLFAINGPSGSGKSTLLNMITGIDRPTSGRVIFAGEELRARNEDALARWRGRHVGIVFQFFQLVPTLTVRENVLLAMELGRSLPRSVWEERTRACLAEVGMEALAGRLPSELSGGQQQRVAIARAMVGEPSVLLADEPTGNLDSLMARGVMELLEEINRQGTTIIMVTHDPELAARAQRNVHIIDGQVSDLVRKGPTLFDAKAASSSHAV